MSGREHESSSKDVPSGADERPGGERDAASEKSGAFDLSFPSGTLEPEAPTGGHDDEAPSQRETIMLSRPSARTGAARRLARSFEDGLLLAGRFRIVRFLGEGGMGEVYEAEDLELRERVALKTVRAETAEHPRAMDEFRREVHLARKVTHPNVCRIFDVFHHREAESGADVTFVTMELLPGETLSQRLRREGRLKPAAVLPIARQMAAALAAAHARGVVHRDFKGANVMLVPAPAAEGSVRAVVTDFGLARGETGGDDSFGTLHTAGRIAGTPAYMAPEQVSGGPVTPAIDVYALGIVLYEMLTGRPPFVAESPLVTAMLRLKEAPASLRTLVPDLERQWDAAVLRCLERDPEARFANPAELIAALEGSSSASVLLLRSTLRRSKWKAGAALAVVAALLLGGAWLALRRLTPSGGGAAAVQARPAVAVLGFKNLAGRDDAAWLSTAFAEMLASELAAGGRLRLLPGESVARAKLELALSEVDVFAADTLERLRRNLGSDLVVTGAYLALGEKAGGRVRLDVRVQDARTGEALEAVVENGTEAELAEMVSRCGRQLRAALGVRDVEDRELRAARAAFSSNPAWARLYAEGLEKLRHYDAPAARALFEQAVEIDPAQPLAHSALAEAWDRLGYGENARQAAQRAVELAGSLPREERLLVEARLAGYSFDWSTAVADYRTLWNFFPDNLDYGLRLSETLSRAGQGSEAAAVVDALRRLPAPARDDPRLDLAEAGASLVEAEARLRHAWSLFRMGEAEAVKARAGEARRLYEAAGDRSGAAAALMIQAHVLWMQQGRHDEAAQLYARALAAFRAAGNQRDVASALLNSAGSLAERGDLQGARQRSQEALEVFHEIADRDSTASALTNLGNLNLQLGDPEEARKRQLEAVELFREIGSKSGEAHALGGLGEAHRARGDLGAARRSFEQALARYNTAGQKAAAAATRVQLAVLHVDEGNYGPAAEAARAAAEELRQAGHSAGEALAQEALARARLGQGRVDDARAAVLSAEARTAQESRGTRLAITITAARVQAAAGGRGEAAERLRAARDEARSSGRADLEFEARLALGVIGAERLDVLARDARRHGFELIARQAEKAR